MIEKIELDTLEGNFEIIGFPAMADIYAPGLDLNNHKILQFLLKKKLNDYIVGEQYSLRLTYAPSKNGVKIQRIFNAEYRGYSMYNGMRLYTFRFKPMFDTHIYV